MALLALAGCGGSDPTPQPGSTLRATLVDRDGDGRLEPGPREPLRDRGGKGDPGRALATFAQITDAHIRDEESPARAPFLDRYGDPFEPTFRPHEALTPHLLTAAVRALNRERPQAVFATGDLIDNAQANELEQARAVLDGGTVRPDTGARGYRGVQEKDNPDPLYYRPDLDAPRHPGMLDRAQRPFRSPGLDAPWHLVPGNHDVKVAGEVRWDERLEDIARGRDLVASLDPRFRPSEADRADPLTSLTAAAGRRFTVPADPQRGPASVPVPRAPLDVGGVRAVLLDTNGPIAHDRLRRDLEGAERAVVLSHHPLDDATLAVLDAAPNVVAAISGHRHRHRIEPRAHYWLISTASLVDFPQQARMFRVRERAIETWLVDHDGRGLAGTARELAFLDAQGGRPQNHAGARRDRNVRLF
jgi:predicted phosphodiesterase